MSRNYIDWLLALMPMEEKVQGEPAPSTTPEEKVLNADHYGLEKIKERILEFLAVRQLVKEIPRARYCVSSDPRA